MQQQLLLLHGALGSERSLQPLKESLQNDFDVYRFSFQGHGESELPESDFTIAGFANEVIAFLDENQIKSISVFGYSMGGYVGLYLAKHFPERIQKLVTLATKLNWTIEGSQKMASMLNPIVIKEKVPKYASSLEQMHGENWEQLMTKTAQMMLNLGQNPEVSDSDFEQISLPILLSVGDKDDMVTLEETIHTHRKIQHSQLLVLPKTIHPIEKVDVVELAHQIKRFL
ncbi:alpha/beta hydrolase [Flavobacterium sp.]|uniref:alpha/beta fold hydrolase n=1 Tax=Flavobacterium sp. TaxID=239 RepID=UPI002B4B22CD|nr:alpha/beta hydrolase [Flavobacterium sp.]HLP64178.1 alpha/beta hydrolase [Flavobacterium sp.]